MPRRSSPTTSTIGTSRPTGYIQCFQQAEFIRGHEVDNWTLARDVDQLPTWVEYIECWRPGQGRQYANLWDFRSEEDQQATASLRVRPDRIGLISNQPNSE